MAAAAAVEFTTEIWTISTFTLVRDATRFRAWIVTNNRFSTTIAPPLTHPPASHSSSLSLAPTTRLQDPLGVQKEVNTGFGTHHSPSQISLITRYRGKEQKEREREWENGPAPWSSRSTLTGGLLLFRGDAKNHCGLLSKQGDWKTRKEIDSTSVPDNSLFVCKNLK